MSEDYKNKIIVAAVEALRQRLIRVHSSGERRNEKRLKFEAAVKAAKSQD